MTQPLMPMATAVWLVDNTGLTFKQVGNFCNLHELEVQGIADGTVAVHMVGQDPTANGQLSQEEIDRCTADPDADLAINVDAVLVTPRTKGPRYTPVSRRSDKPDAIAWLVRYHPEVKDPQISRLIGTTKNTITKIRDRTHWNMTNITPKDPVALGLCKQLELDAVVQKAAEKLAKDNPEKAAATATLAEQLETVRDIPTTQ